MPCAVLVAGANGAGKTTFVRQFLHVRYPDAEFLNSDEIQREGKEFARPLQAGRELLRRLATAESERRSFVLETTLSSRMYARRLALWNDSGYRSLLHFIEVPSADFAVNRVEARVAAGGHSVPDEDIRRRFSRGKILFRSVFRPLVHEWYHWESDDRGLNLVGRSQGSRQR